MTRLVLLHGFTGSPESWSEVRSALGESPVVAPALLGHDGTDGEGGADSFDAEVDRLAARIAEGGRGAHLVGYSLGARLALALLARYGRLFSGATLIGVHPGLDGAAERAERRAADERWCELLEQRGIEAFVDAWEAQSLFVTQRRLPPARLRAQRERRLGHNPRGLARSLRVLGLGSMPSLRGALGGIAFPVRVLAGERDPRFAALAAETARALPRGEASLFPGAGHNLSLERPDLLAAALREGMAA